MLIVWAPKRVQVPHTPFPFVVDRFRMESVLREMEGGVGLCMSSELRLSALRGRWPHPQSFRFLSSIGRPEREWET